MLLSELLAAPALGLELVHEASGSLERRVGRPITTDLLAPGRYLSGGELLITGLVWRRSPEDSETFVASVARRGVSILLAGEALLGEVPDDLVAACRRHDVTLVKVPTEVPFADITEHVAAADTAETGARLSASLGRHRELLAALAAGRSLDELVERISTDLGHRCRVVTPTGRHVVPGPGELDAETLDALTRRFVTAERLPTVAPLRDRTYSLFAVGSALGSRLTTWFLVAEGDHGTWPRDHVEAVHELAAIAALDRARRDEHQRARRPIACEAVSLVESGGPHAEVAARLRQLGLDPDAPLVAAVADLSGAGAAESAAGVLEDLATGLGPPLVAEGRDGCLVALLPAEPGLAELLRTGLLRLAPGTGRAGLAVGVSGAAGVDALAGALDEARFAVRVARGGRAPVTVVGADELTSHVLLLAAVPDDVRRTYALRVLGPLVEHDERTHGELVATLTEFLACSGSWARTAEALHLHVNTVRYRMERVEELTGRDLSRLEDRVDVFLALKSL